MTDDLRFDELLQEDAAALPPPSDGAVNPWQMAMGQILWGMGLTTITLNILYLDYILPALGAVLLVLGFRTLRRENKPLGWCYKLALAALILYVMIRSIGRGFVSSFIHLLGLAAACIVAALLSGKAAAWLYDGYLAERLQTAVSDTLRQKLATFVELLDRIDPTDTISAAAGDALRTVMVAFLTMVAFLIIFLLAMLIVRALAKLTRNVNRVPVVGGVNRVLGGVLGAAEAFLLCYLLGMAVTVLITISENRWGWLNTAVVQQSTLLNWFVQFKFPV